MNRDKTASCEGKVRFDSAKIAWETASRNPAKGRKEPRVAYRCSFCGGWHLGAAVSTPAQAQK